MKNQIIAALALAAFGATMPVFAAQETKTAATVTGSIINVSGIGEVAVTPDIARITIGVQTNGKDSTQTASMNAQKTDAVIKAIKTLGVADKDIQTSDYGIAPQFDYQKQPPLLTGYQVSNSVRITVRKMADAGKVLDAALKAGANVAGGIQFDLSDPQKAQDDALAKAVVEATRKANLMAKAMGARNPVILVELTENTNTYRPPMPILSMAKSADMTEVSTPVQAGETKITATVSARFSIPAAL